jgi:DNA modification methylase
MKLINNDCIAAMKEMADNSVDSIVTDPPYELGFMGKSWDASGIAFNIEVWQEALRILKPGGHLIAFSGSRTYHRMAVAIEDAGFQIRDQIMWVYGSGFPKSLDVSKAIDKSDAGIARRNRDLKFTEWMRSTAITAKQINEMTESNMGNHYLTDKEQPAVATAEMFGKLRQYLPEVPEWIEEMVRQRTIESENFKKREVLGMGAAQCGQLEKTGVCDGHFDNGTLTVRHQLATAPSTAAAKQWNGWGTALKPAHEPMVLARKPIVGTVATNVLLWGTGGLNIDASRVSTDDSIPETSNNNIKSNSYASETSDRERDTTYIQNPQGRWPANFIHDGSDEVLALFPEGKSVQSNRGNHQDIRGGKFNGSSSQLEGTDSIRGFNDSGSAARFFYCAKASKKDRNEGLDGFEVKRPDTRSTTGMGTFDEKGVAAQSNHHPTVKPTDLMRYLCRLITPPAGIVLDPFMGSGSTGKAAILEGFDFIGIDQSAEYVEIAKARIEWAANAK